LQSAHAESHPSSAGLFHHKYGSGAAFAQWFPHGLLVQQFFGTAHAVLDLAINGVAADGCAFANLP
jgi:hypothetical protein